MVCQYCQTRNQPAAAICVHCGAILRLSRVQLARPPKPKMKRSTKVAVAFITAAAVAGAIVGYLVLDEFLRLKFNLSEYGGKLAGALIGATVGGALMYIVSGTRIVYLLRIRGYESRLSHLQSQLNHAFSQAEEKYEKQL